MAALPGGVITFLFTNIEGSTRLWEHHPETMQSVLKRHNTILRATIDIYGGHLFDIVGDAFYAAFTDPHAAIGAALAAQRTLSAQQWQEIDELWVRMALHTDNAEPENGGYVSLPLNRVARLLEAGHGGQILLSQTTEQLVRQGLPPDIVLRDLGLRRLRDLLHPMTIFQLQAPDLRSEFPPLRTSDARRSNLPAQSTSFIGRSHELDTLCRLLRRPEVRLLTLTGPAGTGKTRLGLQAAARLFDEFSHGACFVALSAISDHVFISSAIAQRLGLRETGGQLILQQVKRFLQDREMLLVLDNFEHLISAAPQVTELLAAAPRLKVLATSREVLRVYGEHEFPVPPLGLPDPWRQLGADALRREPAVALFLERARAVSPGLALSDEDLRRVAEICLRLDGLPLGIELAAAWARVLQPQAILARLKWRFDLLVGGARDLPARQQSLRAAIDWSYNLLSVDERQLFARLGVFSGGCTLEAVEALSGEAQADLLQSPFPKLETQNLELFDVLSSLVDKSLLRHEEPAIADGAIDRRFHMLESIREYACELLVARGELELLRRRHAEYYLALAERAAAVNDGEDELWTERLVRDHDNIRAAMEWSHTLEDGAEYGLRLGWALRIFWNLRGYFSEGRAFLERVLARPETVHSPALRGRALYIAGRLAFTQGDYTAAHSLLEESLSIFRAEGDSQRIPMALSRLGAVLFGQGEICRARSLLQQALALFRRANSLAGCIFALNTLGEMARYEGDYEQAEQLYREALQLGRRSGSKQRSAITLHNLGHLAAQRGDYEQARALFHESADMYLRLGYRMGIALCLAGMGRLAGLAGDYERAACLLGATAKILSALGASLELADRRDYERTLEFVRGHLPEPVFLAAWEDGHAMQQEQAIEYAFGQRM